MVNPSRPCLNRRHLGSSLLPVRERKKEQSFSELLYAPEPVRTGDSCIPHMRYRAFACEYLPISTKTKRSLQTLRTLAHSQSVCEANNDC